MADIDTNLLLRAPSRSNFTPNFSQIVTHTDAENVAKEFETLVLAQFLQPLFEPLETDGLTGGGAAERAFRPLLIDEYAKAITDSGGIGIAENVLTEILRIQGLD